MNIEKNFELTDKQRILSIMPLLIGGFIALLNETILNVAFPELMTNLHVSTSNIQWLGTAYMLMIGILVPVAAFLLRTFSTKTLYLTAMFLFTIGTIFCGLSPSFPVLLISRIVQGAGAGMMMPIMMNTIVEIYPPEKRGTAVGIAMMVVLVAPSIGPTISGLVLQALNWRWLFFLLLPVALVAIILGAINLKNLSTLTKPKIDILSIVLSTIGFGGFIFGISYIENIGFSNSIVPISLLCGIGGLILFSKRQFALKQPMLELRTLKYPMFTLGVAMIFITFMIPFAVNIILPTYMQGALGLTPFVAGLALLPGGILNALISPLSGRLYDKLGAKLLATVGFAALIIDMFFLSHISGSTTLTILIALQVCMTLGVGLIFAPIQANSLNQLPKEYSAHGVTILNTALQIAAAFGSSLFIGLMGATQEKYLSKYENPGILQQNAALISGVDIAFTAALILVAIGLILSFFIKQREKEAINSLGSQIEPLL
ncbi:MAG TPA: MDR family MFS transporter [Methanosarcina sp.]|jgi:DHA2 family lincomycin resistance protein-like MFS transporter